MKKIYLFIILSFLFIFPGEVHAAVDATGEDFNEYEKNVGDLSDGLIFPLIKDIAFSENGDFNLANSEDLPYDLSEEPPFIDQILTFTPEENYGGYFVIRVCDAYQSLTYKVYARVGNEAKLLLELGHPEYVNYFRSTGTCKIYSLNGTDYISIQFANTYPQGDDLGSSDADNYYYNYKVTDSEAVEIESIPADAISLVEEQAENDSGDAYYHYTVKNTFVEFYNNFVKGFKQKEYKDFFGDNKKNEVTAFKQSIAPILSESAPLGKIDSSLAYAVYQETAAKIVKEGYSEQNIDNLYNQINIFDQLEASLNSRGDDIYNEEESWDLGLWRLDRAPLEEFFKKYYGFSLVDGSYSANINEGSVDMNLSDGNLEFQFNNEMQNFISSVDVLAISDVEIFDSYALIKAAALRYVGFYATDNTARQNVSRYILVRRDLVDDSYTFKPIYTSAEVLTDEEVQNIISEDQKNNPTKVEPISKENIKNENTQAPNTSSNNKLFIAIAVLVIVLACIGFYLYKKKKDSGQGQDINYIENTKKSENNEKQNYEKQNDKKVYYCSECGNIVKEDDIFCEHCGADLRKQR